MGKLIDIHEGKTLRLAKDWEAALADAAALRLQIDVQLDKRGGRDAPSNMQWQTIADAKAKDR